jgi:hypothetical protein
MIRICRVHYKLEFMFGQKEHLLLSVVSCFSWFIRRLKAGLRAGSRVAHVATVFRWMATSGRHCSERSELTSFPIDSPASRGSRAVRLAPLAMALRPEVAIHQWCFHEEAALPKGCRLGGGRQYACEPCAHPRRHVLRTEAVSTSAPGARFHFTVLEGGGKGAGHSRVRD